jgi:hypothetical protein
VASSFDKEVGKVLEQIKRIQSRKKQRAKQAKKRFKR